MGVFGEVSKDKGIRLTKPLPEAIYTVGLLKKLDHADISTLDHRIVCQKIVYFAMHMGLAPSYSFNLYLRGPYSTDLAYDLRSLSNKFAEIGEVDFLEAKNKRKFELLEGMCEELSYDPRMLEIAATLYAYRKKRPEAEAILQLKASKCATDAEVKRANAALKHARLNSLVQ